jgi:hypothetical protein
VDRFAIEPVAAGELSDFSLHLVLERLHAGELRIAGRQSVEVLDDKRAQPPALFGSADSRAPVDIVRDRDGDVSSRSELTQKLRNCVPQRRFKASQKNPRPRAPNACSPSLAAVT